MSAKVTCPNCGETTDYVDCDRAPEPHRCACGKTSTNADRAPKPKRKAPTKRRVPRRPKGDQDE